MHNECLVGLVPVIVFLHEYIQFWEGVEHCSVILLLEGRGELIFAIRQFLPEFGANLWLL